ncbi:hypothetical protein FRC12_016057 [Ceratobasidium sp. 428]|nr:hypothetical protein FRC12_016057 [Ceratobasidium sp. 428]
MPIFWSLTFCNSQSVPKPAPAPTPHMTHGPDRPIDYSRLNLIKEYVGEAMPGPVETWAGVMELINKKKGKDRFLPVH